MWRVQTGIVGCHVRAQPWPGVPANYAHVVCGCAPGACAELAAMLERADREPVALVWWK